MAPTKIDSEAGGAELARIAIQGSAGPGEARTIRDAAMAAVATGSDLVVDCQHAEHLHAAVVQVLLCSRRELDGAGRRLVLANVPPAVKRFLDVAGVSGLLSVEVAR